MKSVILIVFLISGALSASTKQVEVDKFSKPNQTQTVSPIQEKPAETAQVNDSQTTSSGNDRLPYVAIVVEVELEKTGALRDAIGMDRIAAVRAIPINFDFQPPGPPSRNSNKKGSYIATVSYGPNSPSLVYTCYSNNDVDASILNLPNAVQGPYGYVCTVVKGPPGVVTEVQEPARPPAVIPGAVELPVEVEKPQQPPSEMPPAASVVNVTQGMNPYLNPQPPTQAPQNYYLIKGN